MSEKKLIIKKNQYYDSVFLMEILYKVEDQQEIEKALVMMATDENRHLFSQAGFDLADAGPNDLAIAIQAKTHSGLDNAIRLVEKMLVSTRDEIISYESLDEAIEENPDSNLVLISIPGQYAAGQALKAIEYGLNVFIFSDNVSIQDELNLKKIAAQKGVIVMGPDCGVGSIGGIALATGSVLTRGPIGIIAASGSGAQEISALIDRYGPGISHLIGTGGRDLSAEIGGLSMLKAMEMLEEDDNTRVVVLVSKLADIKVIEKVLNHASKMSKPIVAIFLGAKPSLYSCFTSVHPAFTLEQSAVLAIKLATGKEASIGFTSSQIRDIAETEVKKYSPDQKYLKGLYMGGTFAEESLIILSQHFKDPIYSNIHSSFSRPLDELDKEKGHLVIDMGTEEFTRSRPHPVIDPGPRIEYFKRVTDLPQVAVVILDFILGYGVHSDPGGVMAPIIEEQIAKAASNGRHLTIIASVCGTEADPQNRSLQEQKLARAGAIISPSNASSSLLASNIISKL